MIVSRRRFLDAAAALALAAPLGGVARAHRGARGNKDAVAIAQAVREGRTTALAQVEQAIARLERANPKINAVAFPHYDRARMQARAGLSGPLAGVPTLIKDNVGQKGLPNTNGTRLFRNRIADADDLYVQAIERAGLISIGRSTLPEFASNLTTESPFTGNTRNPWNLEYTSGGSSGGSSAAVAAGVVPLAHGNDRAGSIRHAAAPCGLIGLKASRGRMVGEEKGREVTDFMVNGGLSRTVRDTAAWLAATESTAPDAPHVPVGLVTKLVSRKLVIGARQENPRSGNKPDRHVQQVFAQSVALLERLGHEVRQPALAFDGRRAVDAFLHHWEGGVARGLANLEKKLGRPFAPGDVEPRLLGMAQSGRDVTDAQIAEAVEIIKDAANRYVAQFEQFDIYMTPVFSTEPVRIGELGPSGSWPDQRERLLDYACYCWIDNAAGTPAITLPMGFSEAGLPIGIQFVAAPGGERVLLELAYSLENELRWWEQRPPLWVG